MGVCPFLALFSSYHVDLSSLVMRAFTLSYSIFFPVFWFYSLDASSFLRENRGGVNLKDRGSEIELGRIEGAETVQNV